MMWTKRGILATIIATGIVFLVLGVLGYSVFPLVIESVVKSKLVLTGDSFTHDMWKEIPIPIYLSVYMFNITNSDSVTRGGVDPALRELGPYVFLEKHVKVNETFHSNGTVTYEQIRRWHFLPDKSNGSLTDQIVHLNMVLIGSHYFFHTNPTAKRYDPNLYPTILKYACEEYDCSPFYSHTVSALLFDGYEDRLLTALRSVNIDEFKIPFNRFGWFYTRNDSAADGVYSVFTGKGDIARLGLIDTWNHQKKLSYWSGDACNRLDRASAGDFLPPYTHRRSQRLQLFVGDLCRPFTLDFVKTVTVNGIESRRYAARESLFDYRYNDNKCYCDGNDGGCPDNGVASLSPCVYGMPAFVSFPHFMHASQSYSKHVRGLSPDGEKHSFYVDVEPTLGVPVSLNARLQANFILEKFEHLKNAQNISLDRQLYPQLWFSISAQIDQDLTDKIKLVLETIPLVADIVAYVLMGIGVLLFTIALFIKWF